jgi:hypothetical protein
MKRVIHYYYNTYDLGCGCCSDSLSEYTMWEGGKCVEYDQPIALCENEQDLRKYLEYLEPFDVDPDSRWF